LICLITILVRLKYDFKSIYRPALFVCMWVCMCTLNLCVCILCLPMNMFVCVHVCIMTTKDLGNHEGTYLNLKALINATSMKCLCVYSMYSMSLCVCQPIHYVWVWVCLHLWDVHGCLSKYMRVCVHICMHHIWQSVWYICLCLYLWVCLCVWLYFFWGLD